MVFIINLFTRNEYVLYMHVVHQNNEKHSQIHLAKLCERIMTRKAKQVCNWRHTAIISKRELQTLQTEIWINNKYEIQDKKGSVKLSNVLRWNKMKRHRTEQQIVQPKTTAKKKLIYG